MESAPDKAATAAPAVASDPARDHHNHRDHHDHPDHHNHLATATQRQLWRLDRQADDAGRRGCLVPTVLEFTAEGDAEVDPVALREAVALVLGRHPALRSRFRAGAGSLSYRTDGPPPPVGLSYRRDQFVDEAVRATCSTPFELATDAPARAEVVAAGNRTVLALCAHQIVLDRWSRQLLMTQIGEAYRAASTRQAPRLPDAVHPADIPPPTADVKSAEGVRAALAGLHGAPIEVRLPNGRPRPRGRPSGGGTHTGSLGPELTERLRAVADQHDCTTLVTMSALLAATLATHGSQQDFLFGFDWLGRRQVEHWHAVGVFTNTLLLRVDVRDRPAWCELLDRTRAAWLSSAAHPDVPFDAVAGALEPGRHVAVPPVMVDVHAPLRLPLLGPRIRCRALTPAPSKIANELTLDVTERADDLLLALSHPVGALDPAALCARLRGCAADLITNPHGPVSAGGRSARSAVTACQRGWRFADNPVSGEPRAPARLARHRPCRRWPAR